MKLRTLRILVPLAAFALAGGCDTINPANASLLLTGMDRAAVEKVFGKPMRVWQPNREVTYAQYLAGRPGSGGHVAHFTWVGFDREGRVFGHYGEFDLLPDHVPGRADSHP
jgi:hypothetical protein